MTKPDRDQDRPVSRSSTTAAPGSDPQTASAQPSQKGSGRDMPSADMDRYIGTQLRAVYDDIAKQPVPDRFLDLMKRLG